MEVFSIIWALIPLVSLGYFFMFKRMDPRKKYKGSYLFNFAYILASFIFDRIEVLVFDRWYASTTAPGVLVSLLVVYLTLCFHIGIAAERKGRNPTTFTLFALFLSPLLAGIAVGLMKSDLNDQKGLQKNVPCALSS